MTRPSKKTNPMDTGLLVHVKVEIDACKKLAFHFVDIVQLDPRHL